MLPHGGGWREAGVVAEARRFDQPLRWAARSPERLPAGRSFAMVDDANLVLDTVKRAEDSEELVLRLYEAHGARGTARLRLGVPFASARLANGLEEDGGPLEVAAGEVELPYRPHELLTVKVR